MPMPVSEIDKSHHRPIGLEALSHQRQPAVLGELAGVTENIEEALLELGAVGADGAEIVGKPQFKRVAVFLGHRDDERTHLVEQRHDVHVFEKDIHAAGLDLRQIENVVDQAKQVAAGAFDLLEVGDEAFLSEIDGFFLENFAVADDGIERRAQLMAHVGEELRLVPARYFEFLPLVLDFVEQPRVLNRQYRLRRERFHQVDGVLREGARRAAADHQHADDVLAADERRRQPGTETGAQDDRVDRVLCLVPQVGDLDRLLPSHRCCDVGLVDADALKLKRVDQFVFHAVGGA